MSPRERRLVFGEVAELYDAARPSYPDTLVDDLVALARDADGALRALEVGAGTGKATRLLTARGVAVLAVEPSPEMAAVTRRTAGADGALEVIVSDFEHAAIGGRRFPLLYAGQAWHWVSRPEGYRRARAALHDGGHLVAFWNRPDWRVSPLQRDLATVYDRHVPAELRGGVVHPSPSGESAYSGEAWEAEIAGVEGFGEPEVRTYTYALDYTAAGYADMLDTISEVRLLEPAVRESLLAGVRSAIEDHGGSFTLPMRTRACIARAR